MIYFEGGGACLSPHFCDHNFPANLNQMFSGGADLARGEAFKHAILTDNLLQPLPQLPWDKGIFDFTNDANPFNGWNEVNIPYCNGDEHFGTNDSGNVATSIITGSHFVGYNNSKLDMGHIVPTFPNVKRVMLAGSSAGGLGAVFNFGMVQDAFTTKVPVSVLDDSAVGFPDTQYMPRVPAAGVPDHVGPRRRVSVGLRVVLLAGRERDDEPHQLLAREVQEREDRSGHERA